MVRSVNSYKRENIILSAYLESGNTLRLDSYDSLVAWIHRSGFEGSRK